MVEGSSGNVIQGNYIGTNASGTGDLGNTQVGIWLSNASNNTIGGSVSGARNVISGNAWSGIDVTGSGTGNVIRGNYIGTDQTGSVALQNDAWGIRLASASNLVGGTGPDDGNLISGNGIDGILVDGVSGNLIQGNFIGTDRTGTAAIGNAEDGIWLDNASNTTIGGTAAGARNVISGNSWNGVALSGGGAGNVIQGNYIGTDNTGSGPLLGNASNGINGVLVEGVGDTTVDDNRIAYNAQDGVLVRGASGTTISGNTITQNFQRGIAIEAGSGNTITANAIYANSGIGIDLVGGIEDGFGVTTNDAGDVDPGANILQNYPVLAAAVINGATVTITGAINSTASTTFRLEFFASSVGDPSGYGEGERYLDTRNVTTDSTGNASFTFTLAAAVAFGEAVTATATDPSGNTSEFALNVMTNSVPTNSVPGGLIANEDTALPINSISVSDADSNVNSVVLTVLNGWLTAPPAGGATVVGSGTANVTITGPQPDINLTLAGLVYQGNPNYNGTDTLAVRATDAGGLFDQDTVAIAVAPANDLPQALNDMASVAEDSGREYAQRARKRLDPAGHRRDTYHHRRHARCQWHRGNRRRHDCHLHAERKLLRRGFVHLHHQRRQRRHGHRQRQRDRDPGQRPAGRHH